MITEIYIESRRVDISADISSLLTFAIDDVKDFASRSTTFSKTIILPGTGNNNSIFGNIFDTGISNDYDPNQDNIGYNFNAAKSARCLIFQDNLQTFKGTMRLLEIVKDGKSLEYEVALNGELTTLNVALSSGLLSDLDFSAYNQTWDETNVVNSWDNPPGSGVYFPVIDYGNYSVLKHDWDIRTLRPALYVKEYIDKMFEAADFRYDCDLFDTARFKGLVIPHNQKLLQSRVSQVLSASTTVARTMIKTLIGITNNTALWDAFIAGGFSYSAGVFTYTQPTTLNTTLQWNLSGDRYSIDGGSFDVMVRKNGVAIASTNIPTFPVHLSWSWNSAVGVSIATGDTIDIFFQYGGVGTEQEVSLAIGSTMNMTSGVPTLQPVDYGQTITMNDALPQNIRQVDFLVSIVRLFNLYVYEDQFDEHLIRIKPYIDFYSTASSDAVDWTYKLNRDAPIRIKPLSELNSKIYEFNYAPDSDFFNELYKKRYNQPYGSYIFDSQFEFVSQTSKLELIFAPTPLVGYVGEDKVYPTIFKRTGPDGAAVEENTDSVIRIMQTKKVSAVTSWDILNGVTVLDSVTDYGYAGHFDDPDNPADDLNFGAVNELFFVLATGDLTKTQFNIYWSPYMAEITDKDSKLLSGKFYLTARDIFELDFSKYILVDGVLFRLNKIVDYNATSPSDCIVELLKVINTTYTYITFPPVVDEEEAEVFMLWDVDILLSDDSDSLVYQ